MAEHNDLADGQRPLAGVVLCCTSLSQDVRTKLCASAEEMGAVHKLDLTSDVTHLLVGNIATPKYRYVAKERPDIKVILPEFVEAVRELWMAGEAVELETLEVAHRLPSLYGLQVCITGFGDIEQREAMSVRIGEEGAEYHGDLTKTVTHLIAAAPEGHKYKAARAWGLKVVSYRWYVESLGRGMALDESLYDPVVPLEEQGKGAFRLLAKTRSSLGKHDRGSEMESAATVSRKKLRRSKSSRLESQSQDMWQDISAHSVDRGTSEVDQWTDHDERSTSTAGKDLREHKTHTSQQIENLVGAPQGLFSGICILLQGFDHSRVKRLQNFLEPNGARVVQTHAELDHAGNDSSLQKFYILVPHSTSKLDQPTVSVPVAIATEWWVERCLHYKRLFDPEQDPLSAPIRLGKQLSLDQLSISTTGFAGVDLRQVAETVKLLGATYQETIAPSCCVLICGSKQVRKEKAFYARKHRIPVVSAEWLWTCLRDGKGPLYEGFSIDLSGLDLVDFGQDATGATPLPSDPQRPATNEVTKRKGEQRLKRLSNTGTKRATPSLSFQASRPKPKHINPNPQPLVHEDEDDGDPPIIDSDLLRRQSGTSQRTSQPLQELSPNRSPGKNGLSSETMKGDDGSLHQTRASLARSLPSDKDKYVGDAPSARSRPELDADISNLFRTAASRPSSATGLDSLHKRKNRPLGRAPSGISHHTTSTSNHSDRLSTIFPSDDTFDPANDSFVAPPAVVPPSTQLGYETPEAEAHRLEMMKTTGKEYEAEGGFKRIASVGTVKDAATSVDTGVGNRVKGRHRYK